MYRIRRLAICSIGCLLFYSTIYTIVESAHQIRLLELRNNFSSEYFNNYSIYLVDDAVYIDVDVQKAITKGLRVFVNIQLRAQNRNSFRNLFSYDLDVCMLLNSGKATLMKSFFATIMKYGNFRANCPIVEGYYYVKNWTLTGKNIPSFLYSGDYLVSTYGYYGKYRTNKEKFVFYNSAKVSLT